MNECLNKVHDATYDAKIWDIIDYDTWCITYAKTYTEHVTATYNFTVVATNISTQEIVNEL